MIASGLISGRIRAQSALKSLKLEAEEQIGVDIVKVEPGASRDVDAQFLWNLKWLHDNSTKREELLASFSEGSSSRVRGNTMLSV